MNKRKIISQREAHALRRRVAELEAAEDRRRDRYAQYCPGGVHIGTLAVSPENYAKAYTARRLAHAVVCVTQNGAIELYALPLSTEAYEEARG